MDGNLDNPVDAGPPGDDESHEETVEGFPSELFAEDPDAEQLDALYRQALGAMEAMESGVEQISQAEGLIQNTTEPQPLEEHPAIPEDATNSLSELSSENVTGPRISPARILEAALFVGGTQLTTKKLRTLLRGDYPEGFIENTVAALNEQYLAEKRPYEIVFGEGGYRMTLKSDYHHVRNRVFGIGPKEIRLSQDALEVLSLVAYQQPVTPQAVDKIRGSSSSGLLRQLLRRELIALERDPENRKHVEYRTTPRFLELFGLNHIDELPQADELSFK
ncbi:MAG: SMC-Scp complex subunit ScpB [Planctomycetaceae bacterium]